MIDFLAGVPGKLKALNDRLTSTWAAKLTDLRTGLTDARMGYLDKLNITGNVAGANDVAQTTDPMLAVPTLLANGWTTVVDQWLTSANAFNAPPTPYRSAQATTTRWTDVINVSGKGVLEMVSSYLASHATSTGQMQIIVDGSTVFDSGTIPNSATYFSMTVPVGTVTCFVNGGYLYHKPNPGEGVPYRSSLQVRHKLVASGSTLTTYVKARRSSP